MNKPTISTADVQKRVFENKVNKGFNVTDIPTEFCLMYGEVGEAFDAYRKSKDSLGEELADIAIYLLGLAEITGIDLGAEINRKMDINENRAYKKVNGVSIKGDDYPLNSAEMRDYFADGMK